MNDVQAQDRKLFVRELLSPGRILLSIVLIPIFWFILRESAGGSWPIAALLGILIGHGLTSYNASISKRFIDKRFEILWNGCQDRLRLFEEVLKKMRKERVADLREMPNTIYRISDSLYLALRRADLTCHEILQTEKGFYSRPTSWAPAAQDAQAKELYRIADKNVAEYRNHYAGVMGGVERTEAQAAVFMTTVDSLRMKMIGYRLVGKSPDMSSQEFLEAITETKMQLESIDKALEELELTPYPKTISILPPSPMDSGSSVADSISSPPVNPHIPPPMPPDVLEKLKNLPPQQAADDEEDQAF